MGRTLKKALFVMLASASLMFCKPRQDAATLSGGLNGIEAPDFKSPSYQIPYQHEGEIHLAVTDTDRSRSLMVTVGSTMGPGDNQTLALWNLSASYFIDQKTLVNDWFDLPAGLPRLTGIVDVGFSTDNQYIAACGNEGIVLWDIKGPLSELGSKTFRPRHLKFYDCRKIQFYGSYIFAIDSTTQLLYYLNYSDHNSDALKRIDLKGRRQKASDGDEAIDDFVFAPQKLVLAVDKKLDFFRINWNENLNEFDVEFVKTYRSDTEFDRLREGPNGSVFATSRLGGMEIVRFPEAKVEESLLYRHERMTFAGSQKLGIVTGKDSLADHSQVHQMLHDGCRLKPVYFGTLEPSACFVAAVKSTRSPGWQLQLGIQQEENSRLSYRSFAGWRPVGDVVSIDIDRVQERAFVGLSNGRIHVWNYGRYYRPHPIYSSREKIRDIALDAEAGMLFVVDEKGLAQRYDLKRQEVIVRGELDPLPKELQLSRDGKLLLAQNENGTFQVYSTREFRPLFDCEQVSCEASRALFIDEQSKILVASDAKQSFRVIDPNIASGADPMVAEAGFPSTDAPTERLSIAAMTPGHPGEAYVMSAGQRKGQRPVVFGASYVGNKLQTWWVPFTSQQEIQPGPMAFVSGPTGRSQQSSRQESRLYHDAGFLVLPTRLITGATYLKAWKADRPDRTDNRLFLESKIPAPVFELVAIPETSQYLIATSAPYLIQSGLAEGGMVGYGRHIGFADYTYSSGFTTRSIDFHRPGFATAVVGDRHVILQFLDMD